MPGSQQGGSGQTGAQDDALSVTSDMIADSIKIGRVGSTSSPVPSSVSNMVALPALPRTIAEEENEEL